MNQPGSSSVDSATTNVTSINSLRDRRDWLVDLHRAHKSRVSTVTNVANGDWYVEWPDLSQTPEAPTVANQVELGIHHWTAVGGAILPSVKVPVNKAADRRTEKAAVRKRERRVRELWEAGNMSELAALWWGDYAGTGSAFLAGWVNFEEPDPAKRNPYPIRFDPRHAYPITDDNGNVVELLIARKISASEFRAKFPEYASKFSRSREDDIEEWYWYEPDRVRHIIVDTSKDGRKHSRDVTLVDEEWALGFVPVHEVVLPTFDGQRRGIFDQSIHILRTMQRLMVMTIMSTEEHAFPAIGSYDVINPEDFGPGADIRFRSAEGRIERLGPQSHFDVKDLVARLGEEAAKQSVYPQQLTGDPGASIVSSRGIMASMGALDARLAVAHKQFEVGFGKLSGFLLALDEVFCDGDKTIVGDLRDMSEAEEYRPSKDVAGAWVVNCTYGIGAGSDPANIEMRLNMNLSNGLISKETARHQLPFLDDPDAEAVKQFREFMQEALVAGVMQMGDPAIAAEALQMLSSDNTNMDAVIEQLSKKVLAATQEGGGGSDDSAQAVQQAESLARGGIPGNAEQGPPGAALGLPPLGQILGQDSRQVS